MQRLRLLSSEVSLPEIFCLWAGEAHDLVRHNIKHLAGQIRKGNWASQWPVPVLPSSENRRSLAYDELLVSGV
jgi:hypothetical protein